MTADGVPINSKNESTLSDVDGSQVYSITNDEGSHIRPDGAIDSSRSFQSIVLVDGTTFDLYLAYRANAPILLAVCRTCRRGIREWFTQEAPTHGLLLRENAERCRACGELCCPRHRSQRPDGTFLCRRCSRRSRRWSWLRALVFTDEER